jgi:GTP-binding protein
MSQPAPLVALIGRANVGKSRLFNRLLRQSRSLVEDRPGVTRDRVAETARIEGREVLLVDTGGLDPSAEQGIPGAVRAQVERVVADAAVILFVVDAQTGIVPDDRVIADLLRRAQRQVVVVANKADHPRGDALAGEFHALGFPEVIPTSAEHRRGLVDLEVAIAARLPDPAAPSPPEVRAARLAIIGRPNVGKSSLVNRLLGEARNIVMDEPGTTRDSTDARVHVDGREVVLTDTAGLRRGGKRSERLERGSALMALRSIERSDVAIQLIDAAEGVTDQDLRIARLALDRGRPLVLALNKWDRVAGTAQVERIQSQHERRLAFVPRALVLRISARTGAGVQRILPAALELLEQQQLRVPTSDLNRALEDAVRRLAPPGQGRRRAHFYYCTQTSAHPFTVLVFVNDPRLVPANYRRYLESFFRERYGLVSAPVRIRLRSRGRRDADAEGRGRGSRERRG